MPTWLIGAALAFVLREVAAAGAAANWTDIKAKVDAAINDHLPPFAAPGVDSVADMVVSDVAKALQDTTDLTAIATDVVAGDFGKALTDLESLLAKVVSPTVTTTLAAVQAAKASMPKAA